MTLSWRLSATGSWSSEPKRKARPLAVSCCRMQPRTNRNAVKFWPSAKDTKSNGMKAALTVKAGDQVIFSSYAGDELKVGDETYLLMRESDILAIIL